MTQLRSQVNYSPNLNDVGPSCRVHIGNAARILHVGCGICIGWVHLDGGCLGVCRARAVCTYAFPPRRPQYSPCSHGRRNSVCYLPLLLALVLVHQVCIFCRMMYAIFIEFPIIIYGARSDASITLDIAFNSLQHVHEVISATFVTILCTRSRTDLCDGTVSYIFIMGDIQVNARHFPHTRAIASTSW